MRSSFEEPVNSQFPTPKFQFFLGSWELDVGRCRFFAALPDGTLDSRRANTTRLRNRRTRGRSPRRTGDGHRADGQTRGVRPASHAAQSDPLAVRTRASARDSSAPARRSRSRSATSHARSRELSSCRPSSRSCHRSGLKTSRFSLRRALIVATPIRSSSACSAARS